MIYSIENINLLTKSIKVIYMNFLIANKKVIFKRVLALVVFLGVLIPLATSAQVVTAPSKSNVDSNVKIVNNGHLTICKIDSESYEVVKKVKMIVTAYSSTPDQTDDTPFTTASNKTVADGIIANNMFPFGTKVRIPELYGDKIFVVEDRMNQRKGNYHADIWMEKTKDAVNFGAKIAYIEVLEN